MKTMLHDERRIMTQQVHQLKSEVANSKSEAWDSQYELAGVKDRLEDIENKRYELKKKMQLLLHVTKQVNDMCGGLLNLVSFSFAIKWLLLLSLVWTQ
jgi:predicted  nucleic acid-binding Zn-ribbon protein